MPKTKEESDQYRVSVVCFRDLVNATIDRIAIDMVEHIAAAASVRATESRRSLPDSQAAYGLFCFRYCCVAGAGARQRSEPRVRRHGGPSDANALSVSPPPPN